MLKAGGRFDKANELHFYIVGANPSYGYNYRYLDDRIPTSDPNGTNPTPFHFVGKSMTSLESPVRTIFFAEATMKDRARPGGLITTSIGYARIEAPSFWTGVAPSATSQGQLWPRFQKNLVNVGWMDGHVKAMPMNEIRSAGDKLWNGS